MQAIITVFVFPPRESFSNLVSLESLYGTNAPFLEFSLKIMMQFPRASKLLLMFDPSSLLVPLLLPV